jgi:hypothetical protein
MNVLYLPDAIRAGVQHTDPLRGALYNDDLDSASAMGAVKAFLETQPCETAPRWQRVIERVLSRRVPRCRLPAQAVDLLGQGFELFERYENPEKPRPTLHMVISTVWDSGAMSRTDVADWLEREFTISNLTILFDTVRVPGTSK